MVDGGSRSSWSARFGREPAWWTKRRPDWLNPHLEHGWLWRVFWALNFVLILAPVPVIYLLYELIPSQVIAVVLSAALFAGWMVVLHMVFPNIFVDE